MGRPLRERLRRERRRAAYALRALTPAQRLAATVLLTATLLVLVQVTLGSRGFFRRHLAESFPPEHQALLAWGWWFGMQGVTGFLIPVLVLALGFRLRAPAMGLGLGDWRLASMLALAYLPLVAVGTWLLSADPAFQMQYPHLRDAVFDWRTFAIYHALFLLYWLGWEYLWRGFVLFGTAPALGPVLAIVVQAMPFAILHMMKPPAEAFLSVLGGLALGALVWRCRAFWIAVPIHAAQMLILDLWCVLRVRTGVTEGVGLGALRELAARLGT